jgi:uncharacterized MAPEG superfamily protein
MTVKRAPIVALLLLAFGGAAMAQPTADALRQTDARVAEAQRLANEAEQKAGKTEQRVDQLEQRVNVAQHEAREAATGGGAAILFGAFCALWAQNTGRNAWLWFFLGLIFSVITVLVLLYKNSTDRRMTPPRTD